MSNQYYQSKFSTLYKCVVNFLRKSDPEKIIKRMYPECGKRYQDTINLPYSFKINIYKPTKSLLAPFIQSRDSILVGLYFPEANLGDKIKISCRGTISEITITNPNKIYLPGDDVLFLYLLCAQYTPLSITGCESKFYMIELFFNSDEYLVMDNLKYSLKLNLHTLYLPYTQKYLMYHHKFSRIDSFVNKESCKCEKRCQFMIETYHLDYYYNIIQKFLKKYLLNKK